jgi:hypothetical protein
MNSRLLCFLLITVFNSSVFSLFGQEVYGRITDARSKEPLAFVAVIEKGTSNGIYSDIEGYFRMVLTDKNNPLVFHYVGYEDQEVKWSEEQTWQVRLVPKSNLLAEVVVLPGVNPAERIIRKAIENKKINNPESDTPFTYDSYNKLVFGVSLDTAILADSAKLAALDSNKKEIYNFFDQQYLFMMESVTKRKFYPPDHSEETIIANRVSGLKSTDLFLLGTQLQSFSFYGETVDLLGSSYMSPLANGAISKYRFEIADTTYIGVDTVFTIAFQPKSRKNFSGMKGMLYINTNGFALQNVLAEPYESNGTTIKIRQQYEFVDNRKWFPLQLNSTITFSGVIFGTEPMVGEGRSYIKNLVLDAPIKRKEFTPVTLLMAPRAGDQPDSIWNKYREHELDKRELRTYQMIDSVGEAIHLDRKLKWFESLSTGLLPIGPVSFDLSKLIRYNDYEGWRLGGGLRTNDKVSEKFSIGGHAAYGFRDKQWKYGGDLMVHLYKKRNAWVKLIYENDVMELGGNQFAKPVSGLSFANVYPIFVSRMDQREKYEVQLNGRVIRNFSLNVFANQQFIKTYHDYEFKTYSSDNLSQVTNQFHLTETGATLRFAPGEKLVRMSDREVRLGGRYPVFHVRYTKGWDNVLDGQFSYNRLDAMIEKTFKILNVGELSVSTVGGMIPEDVPLSLLYNSQGSNNLDYKKKWLGIATPGAFETMHTNEFQHSQFASVHVRHNFKQLLLKREKFRPQFVLVHNMLWGKFDHKASHNYAVKAAEKGYFESGFHIDGLIKSGITSLGVAAFYRYGPYHQQKEIENFAFKLTAAYVF